MAKSSRTRKPQKPTSALTPAAAPATEPLRAAPRRSIKGVSISPEVRLNLYSRGRTFPERFREASGLLIQCVTYFQDPFVAKTDPSKGFDEDVLVAWEPGLADGPTSSRFAIVDYNADTGKLEAPAQWDLKTDSYLGIDGQPLDKTTAKTFQFHQVSVWALLQDALEFFENPSALGRTIPWAFEGNRLIVVPHAGYGENAYYDRRSKSLQFYYFGEEDAPVYTCLSTDIVHHEFGHAVLDGIRPLFNEGCHPQTGAFHEFVGDLTAILLTLRNGTLRRQLAVASGGKFDRATTLSSLAKEFGQAISGRPYLRTARNDSKMGKLAGVTSPHKLSEVLTGAMFDILIAIGEDYLKRGNDEAASVAATAADGDDKEQDEAQENGKAEEKKEEKKPRKTSSADVFWDAADRMQRMAIQPLDLLPPVEVTFRDYALAVCRSHQLSDPMDPRDYYGMLIKAFRNREILDAADEARLREPRYLYDRLSLSVRHNIDNISRSRAAAYRFLDDNREDLLIPANRDFFVADLYDASKRGRQNLPLPRQIVLQYAWREEIRLDGPQFGKFAGRTTTMLCGGTLLFNENGNALSWMMKPGSLPYGGKRSSKGRKANAWANAVKDGIARRTELLDHIAAKIAAGKIGTALGSPKGMMASLMPPMIAEDTGEIVQFQLSPHLHLSEDKHLADDETGERQWQISC